MLNILNYSYNDFTFLACSLIYTKSIRRFQIVSFKVIRGYSEMLRKGKFAQWPKWEVCFSRNLIYILYYLHILLLSWFYYCYSMDVTLYLMLGAHGEQSGTRGNKHQTSLIWGLFLLLRQKSHKILVPLCSSKCSPCVHLA